MFKYFIERFSTNNLYKSVVCKDESSDYNPIIISDIEPKVPDNLHSTEINPTEINSTEINLTEINPIELPELDDDLHEIILRFLTSAVKYEKSLCNTSDHLNYLSHNLTLHRMKYTYMRNAIIVQSKDTSSGDHHNAIQNARNEYDKYIVLSTEAQNFAFTCLPKSINTI